MKRVFSLIFSVVILITISSCNSRWLAVKIYSAEDGEKAEVLTNIYDEETERIELIKRITTHKTDQVIIEKKEKNEVDYILEFQRHESGDGELVVFFIWVDGESIIVQAVDQMGNEINGEQQYVEVTAEEFKSLLS